MGLVHIFEVTVHIVFSFQSAKQFEGNIFHVLLY